MRFIILHLICPKMFIYLSSCQVTADRDRAHAYLHGTDYEPVAESLKLRFWNPNFHLFTRLKNLFPTLKVAVQEIMKEI